MSDTSTRSARVIRSMLAGILLGFGLPAAVAGAQSIVEDPPPDPAAPGAGVYLVTFGPGARVWEKFGHNGIWIVDPDRGVDRIYDWGRFSFGDGFLGRFVQGFLRYWMGSGPASAYFDAYTREDRSIWVQELALGPAERRLLLETLERQDTDENRFYRYHYYLDNCATRVRDVIDEATGGALAGLLTANPADENFRGHTQRLTAGSPFLNAGLLLVIGPAVDEPRTAWEESFIPMALREHIRGAVVAGPTGAARPLVSREWTIHASSLEPPPGTPPSLLLRMLVIGVAFAAAIVVAGASAQRGGARWPLAVAVGGWGILAGVLGVIVFGLWAGTEHVFTYGNENLAQANPLALGLAVLAPLAVLGGRAVRAAALLSTAIAAVALAGFALQALPGFDQANGAIVALFLPVHGAVAWTLRGPAAYGRESRPPADEAAPSRKPDPGR